MGIARLALATCAALVVACAAPVKVAVEDGRDFTRYGSWSWLPPWAGRPSPGRTA